MEVTQSSPVTSLTAIDSGTAGRITSVKTSSPASAEPVEPDPLPDADAEPLVDPELLAALVDPEPLVVVEPLVPLVVVAPLVPDVAELLPAVEVVAPVELLLAVA